MKQLDIKHLAPYLPYEIQLQYIVRDKVVKTGIMKSIIHNESETHPTKISIHFNDAEHIWMFKPILYPLDYLTKEITHNGETFVPIEHFEIGDDDNCCYEFDNGNIKLIQNITTIAKYNNWHDINFLPFAVVQQLIEWRFDVFNLINDGLAIPVTEDFNPYK